MTQNKSRYQIVHPEATYKESSYYKWDKKNILEECKPNIAYIAGMSYI